MNADNRSASFFTRAARRLKFAVVALIRLDGPPTAARFAQLLDDNRQLREQVIGLRLLLADAEGKAETAAIEIRSMTAVTERIIQRDLMIAAKAAGEQELAKHAANKAASYFQS